MELLDLKTDFCAPHLDLIAILEETGFNLLAIYKSPVLADHIQDANPGLIVEKHGMESRDRCVAHDKIGGPLESFDSGGPDPSRPL